jgi:integrase
MARTQSRLRPYLNKRTGLYVARVHNPEYGTVSAAKRYSTLGSFAKKGPCRQRDADCCAQHALDDHYDALDGPVRLDTVRAYFALWLAAHPRSRSTNGTYSGKVASQLEVEIPLGGGATVAFGDMRLVDVQRSHVHLLIEDMLTKQGRSVNGVYAVLRTLSAMGSDAVDPDRVIQENPFSVKHNLSPNDQRIRKRAPDKRIWDMDQMHEFASQAGPWEPLVRTYSDCGVRLGELFALRHALQNFDSGWLRVKGSINKFGDYVESSENKNHDREVPLPPSTAALLKSIVPRLDSEWLFYTPGRVSRPTEQTLERRAEVRRLRDEEDLPWLEIAARIGVAESTAMYYYDEYAPRAGAALLRGGGKRWTQGSFYRRVWNPLTAASLASGGIEKPTPQEFRASWESHLRKMGVNREDLAAWAGHSVTTADKHYVQPAFESANLFRQIIG